jgi:hypothetical protein
MKSLTGSFSEEINCQQDINEKAITTDEVYHIWKL